MPPDPPPGPPPAAPSDRLRWRLGWLRFHLGRREVILLALLAAFAGGTWAFVELAEAVTEGTTHAVDERILMVFRSGGDPDDPIGPHVVETAVRDVTALGGVTVVVLLTLTVIGYFLLDRRPATALFVALAVAGGAAVTFALKFTFNRTRPDLLPTDVLPPDPSFPSGHAATAAVVYLTLGVLLARALPKRRLKAYVVGVAIVLTVAVGVSRVYLGVHWPTDVLAGWTVGALWALACWQAERMLQRRGHVEQPAPARRRRRVRPRPAPPPPADPEA